MATGDFGAVLDSEAFGQIASQPPTLRKRTENVALLLTVDPAAAYPYLRSLSISNLGVINTTPIDTLRLPSAGGRDMGLLHWLDDVFVIYHNDAGAQAKIWTVGCDDAGEITDAVIDDLALSVASNGYLRSDLIKPHDGVLLTGPTTLDAANLNDTALITDPGMISDTITDSMALANPFRLQRLRQGAGDCIVCLATQAAVYHISTFTCSNAGALPAGVTDAWASIASASQWGSLCKISDTVFAVFVKDDDNTAQIHTFSINANGTINKSWLDSEQIEASGADDMHMMEMGEGYFVLAYIATGPVWRLKTYFIAADGTIQDGHIDTLDRATGTRGNSWLENLNGNIWTLTYEDVDQSVRVDTIEISTPGVARPHNELMVGIGP